MSRPIGSLRLVGDRTSDRAASVLTAWGQLPYDAVVRHSPDVTAAVASLTTDLEVIVLLQPTEQDIDAACAACDRRGLPRWAVLPASREEGVSPEFASDKWSVSILVPCLRSAVVNLALRRDNARLRGDLATVSRRLTHDLRTQLNTISIASQALNEPDLATDSARYLQAVATALENAGNLIEQLGAVLLASSRPLDLQPVNMEEVLWRVLQRLDGRVRSAGATVISGSSWPAVTGAGALLELVWMHLVLNSLQHGGAAPRIAIGWTPEDSQTRFWIRDTGPGVASARRAHLFHPLDRLNELNAPRGYGLSFVQRLIELHHGTTGYDSQPAPGGTFFFTLPS
jgi:signal transduction histidine kinase